ncbi:MAG TPA: glycosyl hydrolase family 28-related protein [Candidatus Saccharimonadia bacterium]|nr:glycosyl hydrolase family 28-related protein [Candidatus Saccharimonadia bacterium]
MSRLPTPGSDDGTWGAVLNDFLSVEHNTDGTLKPSASLASKVSTTRSINSGTGLSGGGDLTADRTLAVTYGTTPGTAAAGNDTRITGAIQSSTLTSKGDLLAATGTNTITRLGVGSDAQVLTADSSQATGVKWAAISDASAVHKGDLVFNVKDYGAVGDGATNDAPAIQAAINAAAAANGGTVLLPSATYNITTTLIPVDRVRICGTAWGRATLLSTTVDLFNMGNAYHTLMEIDHLRLDVTNGHAFTGAYLDTSSFHNLQIFVRSAGKSVWSATNITLMVQCYFSEIQTNVYGATRSVPAWNLVSGGIDKLTECSWDRIVAWNQDSDNTQYQFYCVNNGTASANRNLAFRNIVFEHPYGGSIYVESSTGTLIDNCHTWDTAANTILAASFYVGKNAGNSIVSANTIIRNSGRDGDGISAGVSDIKFDASCLQTLVEACSASGTGINVAIDLGSSDGVLLLNMPASFTTRNAGAATYIRTTRGSIYAQPSNGSNAYTGSNSDSSGGDTTYKGLHPNASSSFISANVTSDTVDRFRVLASGQVSWGDGTNTRDTNLYRSAASTIKTDGSLVVAGSLTVGGASVSAAPILLPTDMGYVSWTYDPIGCRAGQVPTAGVLYLARIQIRSSATLTNIFVGMTTAGSGLTSNQNFVGLYNSSGTLLGNSADQTASWASGNTEKQIAFSSSVSVTSGFYWVAFLANGTTTPTFAVGSQLIGNLGSGAASASTRRFGQYSSSLTSLPSTITPGSITQTVNQTYWAAVN